MRVYTAYTFNLVTEDIRYFQKHWRMYFLKNMWWDSAENLSLFVVLHEQVGANVNQLNVVWRSSWSSMWGIVGRGYMEQNLYCVRERIAKSFAIKYAFVREKMWEIKRVRKIPHSVSLLKILVSLKIGVNGALWWYSCHSVCFDIYIVRKTMHFSTFQWKQNLVLRVHIVGVRENKRDLLL